MNKKTSINDEFNVAVQTANIRCEHLQQLVQTENLNN